MRIYCIYNQHLMRFPIFSESKFLKFLALSEHEELTGDFICHGIRTGRGKSVWGITCGRVMHFLTYFKCNHKLLFVNITLVGIEMDF